jgi:hypothetical protein
VFRVIPTSHTRSILLASERRWVGVGLRRRPRLGRLLGWDKESDDLRIDFVGVTGWRGPDESARLGLVEPPTVMRLVNVVPAMHRAAAVGCAGGSACAHRRGVVEVACLGWMSARREAAGAITGVEVFDQVGRWGVVGSAVVEQSAGDRVGKQPPPGAFGGDPPGHVGGDRTVSVQVPWLLIEAEQGADRYGDSHRGTPAVPGAERLADVAAWWVAAAEMSDLQRGPAQLGEGVGAELVKSSGVVGVARLHAPGGGVDGGPECGEVLGCRADQAGGHAVWFRNGGLDFASGAGPGVSQS